jgi:hypothetical protein
MEKQEMEAQMTDIQTASSVEEIARIEVGLLTTIFERPERLPAEALIERAMQFDLRAKRESYKLALCKLREAGLIREEDGRMVPTEAALHFDSLPF